MGLFDNIKKIGLDKIVDKIEDTIGTTTERVTDAVRDINSPASPGGAMQNTENGSSQNMGYTAPQNTGPIDSQNNAMNINQKFEQIFSTEFSDLQVSKEVSPDSVGIVAPTPCRPYSYALRRNGQPVAVIMLTPHNRDHNAAFINAKAAAQNSNIVFLNFYTHFQNERNYVVTRIRNAL